MAAPEAWRARSCWFCEVAAATTMEATSREAAPAKSSASGPSAPPALFELCGRAVSAHMGVLESGVWALPGPILQSILPLLNIYYLERIEETALKKGLSTQAIWRRLWDELMKTRPSSLECLGLPALEASQRFRSISTLELFTVPLSTEAALTLCHLLSSWVSLESLTLSYNGLGSNIFRLLDSLRALSGQAGCRLRALHLSDLFSPLPILELTRAIVRALPLLRVLSIRVDHPSQRDNPAGPENAGPPSHIIGDEEIPENCLEQLEMGFPRGAQPAPLLCSVLKASGSLQQLSLDSATFASPQDFGLVLQTLKEYNLSLKRLSFHDMNLADCQSEVLFLLQNLTLQEITFSFCRLFEKRPAQFLPEMVAAMKGNSTLKGLRLPGNRLGNAGLLALADVFSEDSSSSLCQLDISSNCIKPDGLLEFAKRLERWGRGAFGHLRLFQNWLDQDAVTAREAIRRLRATCHVVSDSWDSSQAFADYVSTM
uniref:Leucine-rich repeat-containing protein 41 n=1 Tax=Jaculus jaculus TaxID=51337 RepID=A0A8C5JV25_JACJA